MSVKEFVALKCQTIAEFDAYLHSGRNELHCGNRITRRTRDLSLFPTTLLPRTRNQRKKKNEKTEILSLR